MSALRDGPAPAANATRDSSSLINVDDSDLDPAAFLKSVRELSEKREREDNERFRKLEAEIEKGRQERLARRAEYARSISPEKRDSSTPLLRQSDSPSVRTTDSAPHTPRTSASIANDTASSARSSSVVEEVPEFKGFGSASRPSSTSTPFRSMESPIPAMKPSPSVAMPSRSGTMKWQQRPQSRAGASRPLSSSMADNNAENNSSEHNEPSRDQIAAALGARDPSWFRQTADRGSSNAAFRKSKDELIDTDTAAVGRQGLPGMARDNSRATPSTPHVLGVRLPSQATSTSTVSTSDGQSSIVDNASVRSDAEAKDTSTSISDTTPSVSRASASSMSISQARLSKGVDASPPKDMGGFVQSAMMKRSNSITKRSLATSTSPTRASSIRGDYAGLPSSMSMPKLEQPSSKITGLQTDSLVRPTSESNLTKVAVGQIGHGPQHSRTNSITSAYTTNAIDTSTTLPSSASKRWSPNKSSWIESALTAKPDSRPASPSRNSQPAWMSNLAKARSQRSSAETQSTADGKSPQAASPITDLNGKVSSISSLASMAASTKIDAISAGTTTSLSSSNAQADAENALKRSSTVQSATPSEQEQVVPDVLTKTKSAPSPKPQVPSSKPQLDFRSTLKSRAPAAPKASEQPEFLSRFGSLRKTATEKYVAPDVLKDNILRGKAGLAVTDGPQKSTVKDEFKDSLLAKKDQWRKDKEDGIVNTHKTAAPATPSKPEALAKRELLGRSDTVRVTTSPEKEKTTTPEALRRHQSIKAKPSAIDEDRNVPAEGAQSAQPAIVKETSKLAARFNPHLAGMLARGPMSPPSTSDAEHGTYHEATPRISEQSSEAATVNGQLQDMRKGRAKGPKRRKVGASSMEPPAEKNEAENEPKSTAEPHIPTVRSSASIMAASLNRQLPPTPPKPSSYESPNLASKPLPTPFERAMDDDKENTASPRQSVKDAISSWTEDKNQPRDRPPQIQLPSKKDEEAAMRSAGLLAAKSPPLAQSATMSATSPGAPPKPSKSSRAVSGQLNEPKSSEVSRPVTGAEQLLVTHVGCLPLLNQQLSIDVRQTIQQPSPVTPDRPTKRAVYHVRADGSTTLAPRDSDHILFSDGVYIIVGQRNESDRQIHDIYVWVGAKASEKRIRSAERSAKQTARNMGATLHQITRQGHESRSLLELLGGILVTRKSDRSEPYILCARKHLNSVVLDEVDYDFTSLCSAFTYLINTATSNLAGQLYLWKGSACSTEEMSGARLAAMDLSINGNIVEVDDKAEFPSFLKVFGSDSTKDAILPSPPALVKKMNQPGQFRIRLFEIRQTDSKGGFFASMLARRPSWGSRSPVVAEPAPTFEAKEITPFLQTDLHVERVYVLDGYTKLHILLGPLLQNVIEPGRSQLVTESLLFAEAYAKQCAELERRYEEPDVEAVLQGVSPEISLLFRHWSDTHGLWGTAGLMAGARQGEIVTAPVEDILHGRQRV